MTSWTSRILDCACVPMTIIPPQHSDDDDDKFADLDFEDALLRLRANDNTLIHLILGGKDIGDEEACTLADAFKENTVLTNLNLDGNKIGDEGARALAEALERNTALTQLNLKDNNIRVEGARALTNFLRENTTLTQLLLRRNKFGAEGARALAGALKKNTALAQLTLGRNEIGAEGARALAEALKENTALTQLDLRTNEIGDEGARALAEAFKENTALTQLNLEENGIGVEGGRALAEALKKNTALAKLKLWKNNIGVEGVLALADALKKNITLTQLDLEYNGIGTEGARAEGDVKGLTSRNILLQLQGNEVATQGSSFYFGKSDNGDMETNLLCIKETVWKAATTGDGLVLRLVQDVLQKYLAGCGKGDVVKLEKESLKKMFDKSTNPEGSPLLHLAAVLDSEEALEMCKFLVDKIGVDFDTTTDQVGRTARDIAQGNARASKWAKSVGTFLDRYYLKGIGRYKSSTCIVHFAVDVEKSQGDPDRNVAIKIMSNQNQFERELKQRLGYCPKPKSGVDIEKGRYRFDEDHVVPLLRYHTEEIKGGICCCLVMVKGQRNLDEVIRYEGIAGIDINAILFFAVDMARALQHLHSKLHRIIHGDFKPRNIVRINGDYKLIDFDASVDIGEFLTEKNSSGYLPPELARVIFRPKETLEALHELKEELKNEWKSKDIDVSSDRDAIAKIVGELDNVEQKIKQIEDSSVATPKENLAANVEMDVWSYGVVMYQMLTGRSLFNCDMNDNLLNDQEKQKLVSWEGITDDDLVHVLKDCQEHQDLVDAAKDLLRTCLSTEEVRPKSFTQILAHPFLNRKQAQLQEIKEGQQEIKDGQRKLIAKVDHMIDKLDMTHKMMSEMQTQLRDISKNVNDLLARSDAPKLMYIIPADSSLKDWINLKSLVGKKVKVVFICPVTFSVPRDGQNKPMGYTMTMPKEWVVKYGPALKISFEVLRVGFAVGRLAGLPLPNLQGIGKITNPLHVLSNNIDVCTDGGGKETRTFAEEIGGITNLTVPEPSKALNGLSDDTKNVIESSYDEVKKIAEDNEDVGFLKTGLTKVVTDGGVEYVLNDPKIKALYEENGRDCIGLTATQLSDLGADLDAVVKEGELEKNSNKLTPQERHRKRAYFNRRQKESWKRCYFVLRKSGLLTYYRSKEERDEDPLGVRGRTKDKRVVQIEDHDKMGSFRVSYDGEPKQQLFKVPATSGQRSPSNRDAAKDWVDAWVDRAKAHLS